LAVYRNDQVDFSFSAEAALGGYFAPAEALKESGGASALFEGALTADVSAGSRTIAVDGDTMSQLTAGTSYILIGHATEDNAGADDLTMNSEIRKVVSFTAPTTTTGVITLNAPLGFNHLDNSAIIETETNAGVITDVGLPELGGDDVTMDHTRFTPGVWETIELPDPAMEIEPRYFLGTESKRNFYSAYKGQQSFSGTLSNFELLNGYPLRFPIGQVATKGTDQSGGGSVTVTPDIAPGDYHFLIAAESGYTTGDYIQVGVSDSGLEEVRKIMYIDGDASGTNDRVWVDYPFLIAHAAGVVCNEVTAPYTHAITETVALSPVTWQVRNRDSSETATNDWLRRYSGGKIGQATITAEEGGTLRMSWDSSPFINMQHNQYDSSAVTAPNNKYDASLSAVTVEFPTSQPYYFSQGSITLFGVEFARVTNFTININNNLEPRYFIRDDGSDRTPSEIYEGRREYSMTATVVLPDSTAGATSTERTLFKELLAEGDYGSGMAGFDIDLVFTRTASTDLFTINIPANQDGNSGTGGNNQGAFIRSANTSISTDNPVSTEVDILFRNMSATIVDSEPVYP
jgi:hypothetical protein